MCEKLDGLSMDLEKVNREKLKSVFPECFSEGKLDIDKLLSLCGEYIDNDFEKYKFEWKGKSECLRLAQKRSAGTLRPCKEKSVHFDDTQNVYIEGDNLEVLKLLQTAYFNKIKMIYIDPPYNTGNDFVYEDDFADPMARYKEVTQQTTKSNPETMGRYHTNWLNMMYPRLRLAANLLTDDGVIFISIDDNEITNLRKISDEVFGEENFVAQLTTIVKPEGRRYGFFAKTHENILVFAKNIDKIHLNEIVVDGSTYQYYDEIGGFNLKGLRNRNVQAFNSSNRPNLRYPFYVNINNPDKNNLCKVSLEPIEDYQEVWASTINGLESIWRWGKEKAQNEIDELAAYKGNDGEIRIFQKERKLTQMAKTVLMDKNYISNKGTKEVQELLGKGLFDFPKPIELIKLLLSIGTDSDDIILDFFSGSATTAHAVMQLNAEDGGNRKFICVQLPELCDEKSEAYKAGYKTICEIGEERIRRAGQKILEEQDTQIAMGDEEKKPLDIGFKVFRLDTSNLKLWDSTPITGDNQLEMFIERMNSMIESIKDDRSDMDVIYEIMLKMGVPLDTAVQYIEIDGKIVYIVGDFLLMIALYNDITAEDIDAMAAYAPAKIVCAEQGFKDDTALSNAHYILRDKQIELKLV